uniref:EF-hand domain-containing protein n=1 Tax=Amphiprion percula TaxID=161767 RepID=A0A3P8SFS3_AMPPE
MKIHQMETLYCIFFPSLVEPMSDLEVGMVTIIRVFHKYSGLKGKLKKAELKDLINNEMNHFIMVIQKSNITNETLDELFADLDQNGDLEIDFKEFITLIAMVTSYFPKFCSKKR